jgi:hypothetical protein
MAAQLAAALDDEAASRNDRSFPGAKFRHVRDPYGDRGWSISMILFPTSETNTDLIFSLPCTGQSWWRCPRGLLASQCWGRCLGIAYECYRDDVQLYGDLGIVPYLVLPARQLQS